MIWKRLKFAIDKPIGDDLFGGGVGDSYVNSTKSAGVVAHEGEWAGAVNYM